MGAGKSSRVDLQFKTKDRTRNWREYKRDLRNRGDGAIWLNEMAVAAHVSGGT